MQKIMEVDVVKNIEFDYTRLTEAGHYRDNSDYVIIGTGEATIEFFSAEQTTLSEIEKLRQVKSKKLAEQALVIEKIEERIQSLLAIGHDGSES